jgi:hypothetical protein
VSSGVLHFVADETFRSAQGDQTTRREIWLDVENGDSRTSERDPQSGSEVVTVRRGRNVIEVRQSEKSAFTRILPDDNAPQLNLVREHVLAAKTGAEQGALQLLGEDNVNGRPVLRLEPVGQLSTDRIEVAVDKEFGVVVREVISHRSGDNWEEVLNHNVTYSVLEVTPRAQVRQDIFTPSIPVDWEQRTWRVHTPTTANSVRDMDIYWLGEQYQGLRAVSLVLEEVSGSRGAQTQFVVTYARTTPEPQQGQAPPTPDPAAAADQIIVISRTMGSDETTARARGGPPQSEAVTVGGRRGFLVTLQPPTPAQPVGQPQPTPVPQQGQSTVLLDLTAGNTSIIIQARDRDRQLEAGATLQRLN